MVAAVTEVENVNLTYTRRLMDTQLNGRLRTPTRTKLNLVGLLTGRRTQTIAQKTQRGLQNLWERTRAQPETHFLTTQATYNCPSYTTIYSHTASIY